VGVVRIDAQVRAGEGRDDLEILQGPTDMTFDENGNLTDVLNCS